MRVRSDKFNNLVGLRSLVGRDRTNKKRRRKYGELILFVRKLCIEVMDVFGYVGRKRMLNFIRCRIGHQIAELESKGCRFVKRIS